jgi:Protein of unknown function (DUF664)
MQAHTTCRTQWIPSATSNTMHRMTDELTDERNDLLECLQYQRDSVLSIVDGLSEAQWHTSVVPSGWTPAGFVDHLSGAEYHWFRMVVAGLPLEVSPGDEDQEPYDPFAAFTSDSESGEIVANYRNQCRISDEILANVSMSTKPLGRHRPDEEVPSVRWVVLHMIEETAAHSGHLEIARELLDGETRRGQR